MASENWVEFLIEDKKERVLLDGSISSNNKALTGSSTFSELLNYLKSDLKYSQLSSSWVIEEPGKGGFGVPLVYEDNKSVKSKKAFGRTLTVAFATKAEYDQIMAAMTRMYSGGGTASPSDSADVMGAMTYYGIKYVAAVTEIANKEAEAAKKKKGGDDGDDGKEEEPIVWWSQEIQNKKNELGQKRNALTTEAAKEGLTYEQIRDILFEKYNICMQLEEITIKPYRRYKPPNVDEQERKYLAMVQYERYKFAHEVEFWYYLVQYAKGRTGSSPEASVVNVPPASKVELIDADDVVLPQRPILGQKTCEQITEYGDKVDAAFAKLHEAKDENVELALEAWDEMEAAFLKHPMKLASHIGLGEYQTTLHGGHAAKAISLRYQRKDAAKYAAGQHEHDVETVRRAARKLIGEGIKKKESTLHPYLMYLASIQFYTQTSLSAGVSEKRIEVCKIIFNDLTHLLTKLKDSSQPLSKKEKKYAKWLLTWVWKGKTYDGDDYFPKLTKMATDAMKILSKPLVEEYNRLQTKNSPLIDLKLVDQYRCNPSVKSNKDLLGFTWSKWFSEETDALSEEGLNAVADDYYNWKFCNGADKETIVAHLERLKKVTGDLYRRYLQHGEVVMDIINQVAAKINPEFQKIMLELYQTNRKQCDWLKSAEDEKEKDAHDREFGVFAGPIKTKARQDVKIRFDYKDEKPPRAGCVLDIVRCAIVCQDDVEMASLYKLICNKFEKKILRTKNAFSDVSKDNYGYRAVLINVIASVDVNGVEFEMITEIQLILQKYFEVRKSMHLAYAIVRADTAQTMSSDACKLGDLDI